MGPVEEKNPELVTSLEILLAEDNAVGRKVIETVLKRKGHRVTCAADGRQALDHATSKLFDVVLMDMRMPVMDGLEATRAIRQLAPPHGTVPIVALTANEYDDESDACFAAGMNEFLSKTVNLDHLTSVLVRLSKQGAAPLPPAAKPEEAPIPEYDPKQYEAYERAIGADAMVEVRARFETVQADLVQALSDPSNWEPIAWSAHAVAGCARYLGLMALEASCRQLETACRNADGAEVSRLVLVVQALLSKTATVCSDV
ncbi:MAG: response regulator [Rhodospirillaceae bacterium]|nr:response regulator [Rhodospirillales bacterium]